MQLSCFLEQLKLVESEFSVSDTIVVKYKEKLHFVSVSDHIVPVVS